MSEPRSENAPPTEGAWPWLPKAYNLATTEAVALEPRKVKQLIPAHKPGEGAIGDCYRACIASMLGAPDASLVPHFMAWSIAVEQARGCDSKGGWEATRLTRHWLRKNTAFDLLTVRLDAARGYGVPYMLSVQSKTGPWPHCVVGVGDEVWWDPSGVGGYSLADARDDTADVLCLPYDPDPDEMVRQWALAAIADLEAAATEREAADRAKTIESGDLLLCAAHIGRSGGSDE